jgi:hypothetical protein
MSRRGWSVGKGLDVLLVLCLLAPLSGCQTKVPVRVDREDLVTPAAPAGVTLTLLARAWDIRDKPRNHLGRHMFLGLPGPQVVPENGQLDRAISQAVGTALEASGYGVTVVEHLREAAGPVVVVQIDDLRNYLFALPWPIGWGWGRMQLSVHLVAPDGQEIWTARAQPNWGMMGALVYMAGFGMRVNSELEDNVNQILALISTDDFQRHIRR